MTISPNPSLFPSITPETITSSPSPTYIINPSPSPTNTINPSPSPTNRVSPTPTNRIRGSPINTPSQSLCPCYSDEDTNISIKRLALDILIFLILFFFIYFSTYNLVDFVDDYVA